MLMRKLNRLEKTLRNRQRKPGYTWLVKKIDGCYFDYDTDQPIDQLPPGEVIVVSYVSPDKQPYDS